MTDHELARTFDAVAERYDSIRPTYPDALFDDLVEVAGLAPSDRVLEIGCGTGKATVPLATRGLQLTCIEMGPRLAAVARRQLAQFSNATVVTSAFEVWQPEKARFDAVVAFTSFHWIDPDVRFRKAAALLRDAGTLGIVSTHHVLPPDGDSFFRDVQADYEAVIPDDPMTLKGGPVDPELIEGLGDEIAASRVFEVVASHRYRWDVVYGVEDYLRLLETFSNHLALSVDVRRLLLARIGARIRSRPGKQVHMSYLAVLDLARRSGYGTPA
jgi:SAM-dependent methyltransferase